MDLKVGDTFSTTREITDEVIRAFAEVSGDHNPIHLDEQFAAKTRFGRRIAHGALSGAFISAVLGHEFAPSHTDKIIFGPFRVFRGFSAKIAYS